MDGWTAQSKIWMDELSKAKLLDGWMNDLFFPGSVWLMDELFKARWLDGWMNCSKQDGWMDEWTVRSKMLGWMDELFKARWLDGWMNCSKQDGCMDEWTVKSKMVGWMDKLSKERWLDGWMNCPKQDGWMDGWMVFPGSVYFYMKPLWNQTNALNRRGCGSGSSSSSEYGSEAKVYNKGINIFSFSWNIISLENLWEIIIIMNNSNKALTIIICEHNLSLLGSGSGSASLEYQTHANMLQLPQTWARVSTVAYYIYCEQCGKKYIFWFFSHHKIRKISQKIRKIQFNPKLLNTLIKQDFDKFGNLLSIYIYIRIRKKLYMKILNFLTNISIHVSLIVCVFLWIWKWNAFTLLLIEQVLLHPNYVGIKCFLIVSGGWEGGILFYFTLPIELLIRK